MAQTSGIQYLDREVRTIGYYPGKDGTEQAINIYGNPCQPEFLGKPYSFIYKPYPSPEASEAWTNAPSRSSGVHIWAMHSPPLHRLDDISDMYKKYGLIGCKIQSDKITAARPMLAVFGHYHFSWGIERIKWNLASAQEETSQDHVIAESKLLTCSRERRIERNWTEPVEQSHWDFSGQEGFDPIETGEETLFVNAAWKVMDKKSSSRNHPFAITLKLPT
jgi:hypothetical protein